MLPATLIAIFLLLSLLHGYWLCGGHFGLAAAIPEQDGHLAFTPSNAATFAVATALFGCALLVAALAGWLALPLPPGILSKLGYGLAVLFFLRAVGDFKLMGFFKRVRGTRFSRFDTFLYSPLCLLLAFGLLIVILALQA
jgi:hypothetical protein